MYTDRDTTDASARGTLASFAYDELKRRLLVGDFRLGARLGEIPLAGELGVSRTPVRDALARLHTEGLVIRLPEGGYGPAAPDLHTITELYEVRRGLEFTALAREVHDFDALRSLRADWLELKGEQGHMAGEETRSESSFVLIDEDFHFRLALASGNAALAEMLMHVNERIRLVRMQDFLTEDRIRITIDEHLGILDALLQGLDARDRLTAHLDISERIVERRAARALSRMVMGDRR